MSEHAQDLAPHLAKVREIQIPRVPFNLERLCALAAELTG
jgi:hypothetical protein